MLRIELPWPSPKLSPNARGHWASLSRVKKQAHQDGYYAALGVIRENGNHRGLDTSPFQGEGVIAVKLTFHPPTKGRRDLDNFQASQKWALDGIAEAMEVNDSRFRPVSDWGEVCKGGKVIVEIGL